MLGRFWRRWCVQPVRSFLLGRAIKAGTASRGRTQ